MRIKLKKLSLLCFFFILAFFAHAAKYKILDVSFSIKGMTKASVVEREVELDTHTVFLDEDSFSKYINDYKQQLENLRAFESIELTYELEESADDSELYYAHIFVSAKDSFHFIGAPYPKYSSNSGFDLKIKGKDTNFFGTLQTMTFELNFAVIDPNNETVPKAIFKNGMGIKFGGAVAFNYPFSLFGLNANWSNDYSISYKIGEKAPEWNANTGLSFSVPIHRRLKVNFSFNQGFYRDIDYVKYGDSIYFKEALSISMPLTLARIEKWGTVSYTPYTDTVFYWDFNGINLKNSDLTSPRISVGQSLSTSRVNWIGNFRTGFSFSTSQAFSYNFLTKKLSPSFSAEIKAFKGFKYMAFASRIYYFMYVNDTSNVAGRLRGLRDNHTFSKSTKMSGSKVGETPSALVFNFDMPIRLFSTFFSKGRIIPKFNFELQISPFIDIAFIKNRSTGTMFYVKDGFYCAGLELIMLPAKWKSIQVRGSFGVDVGRYVLKKWINTDWRDGSKWELEIGIGLHY